MSYTHSNQSCSLEQNFLTKIVTGGSTAALCHPSCKQRLQTSWTLDKWFMLLGRVKQRRVQNMSIPADEEAQGKNTAGGARYDKLVTYQSYPSPPQNPTNTQLYHTHQYPHIYISGCLSRPGPVAPS